MNDIHLTNDELAARRKHAEPKALDLTNKHRNHTRTNRCKAERGPSFAEIRCHYISAGYTPEQIRTIPYQTLGMAMTDDEINAALFTDEQLEAWKAGNHPAQKKGA